MISLWAEVGSTCKINLYGLLLYCPDELAINSIANRYSNECWHFGQTRKHLDPQINFDLAAVASESVW